MRFEYQQPVCGERILHSLVMAQVNVDGVIPVFDPTAENAVPDHFVNHLHPPLHGGIGYTWEHDLHLYLRRAYAGDYLLGSATWHHDRLAGLLLG